MTKDDPFASWSEDHKVTEAKNTARLLKSLSADKHRARRHLQEIANYYESQQWVKDGVAVEQLDSLLNDLREKYDIARKLTLQTSERLDAILQSQQSYRTITPIDQRRAQLLDSTLLSPSDGSVEPTPLESFLQTARSMKNRAPSRGRKLKM